MNTLFWLLGLIVAKDNQQKTNEWGLKHGKKFFSLVYSPKVVSMLGTECHGFRDVCSVLVLLYACTFV